MIRKTITKNPGKLFWFYEEAVFKLETAFFYYYPFGMGMPGRKYSADGAHRYGSNGKKNNNDVKGEGNQQDYGMRVYDPKSIKRL
jgi:hypothetical protein